MRPKSPRGIDVAQGTVLSRSHIFWLIPLGLLLAVAAFANAAARVEAAIPAFSAFSPSFYGWRATHARAERGLVARPGADAAARLRSLSADVVRSEPLAIPAWRSLALADASTQQMVRARGVMQAADALSRRDAIVQAWLIDDGIRRQDIAGTLRHFDALLRTEPEARAPLLARLVGVLGNAATRRDLAPYVSADTPWYPEFAVAAVQRSRQIAPFATLLADARAVPDSVLLRQLYGNVVTRLIREGQFELLRRVYPRLPGAGVARLTSLSLDEAGEPPYPPVGWAVMNEPDRNAAIVDGDNGGGAIEALAEPLISGMVARRLVFPPPEARTLSWRVADREGWRDSTASIHLRCLDAVTLSGNLFDPRVANSLTLPRPCPVAMVELHMFGGTGRDPATLLIDRISLSGQPAPQRQGDR